jgi:hypothetical protein
MPQPAHEPGEPLRRNDLLGRTINRHIKESFDPGWGPSAKRPREGSLSPISKRQAVTRLDEGLTVEFKEAKGDPNKIASSQTLCGIPPTEVQLSLETRLQAGSFAYSKVGSKFIL